MSENIVFALIPIMALSIPIVAIVSKTFGSRWMALKERQLEITAQMAGEQAAQYATKIDRLEARVQVLERIATDKGTALAAEIENLRLPPLN
jgi:hypothetical protein